MTGQKPVKGRFQGKVMVITGAAQGIGRTVALGAAREGASVVLVDRAEIVHEVRAELEGIGVPALAVTTITLPSNRPLGCAVTTHPLHSA